MNTVALIRLILRRDRVWQPLWILSITLFVATTVATIRQLLPTAEARLYYANEIVQNPVILLLQGPAYGDGLGAAAAQQRGAATTLFAALASVILLVKHTRSDEESGRRELLGSAAVGRHAPLTAALIVVLAANAVLALLITMVGVSAGLPLAGSLAWGLMAASGGWVGAALAAVAVQVTQSARVAGAVAFTVFFAAYLVRGVSDLGGPGLAWLGWLVPNGWFLRARAFGGEQWWVFLLVVAFVAALLGMAYALSARRDLGTGLLPARLGPARAPKDLRGAFGLAWRMHRGMALAWIAGAAFVGAGIGLGGQNAVKAFGRSGALDFWAARTGADDPAEIFFQLVVYELAVYSVSLYAIMTVLRLRGEQATELLLSGPVSRTRWAVSHLLFAVGVPVLVLVIAGLALSLGNGDFAGNLARTTVILPGVWVMAGIALAAFGLFRRAGVVVGWTALALAVAWEVGWEVGLVSDALFMMSPFAHVHYSTLADPGAGTLAGLTLVAAGLVAVGLYGLRRRDLAL
ncbi:ABC transporter permease [Spongiactinospora sp. 9N601]|uniref:ABC transporter permease n=1 Tax=Spongiactinospora sp. 9N601 TaxID=3375149 RepID=UPI00379421AF